MSECSCRQVANLCSIAQYTVIDVLTTDYVIPMIDLDIVEAACVVTSLAIEKEASILSSVVDQVSSQEDMDLHNVSCVSDVESANENDNILPISSGWYELVPSIENGWALALTGSQKHFLLTILLCLSWYYFCWEFQLLHWKEWGLLQCNHPSWLEQCSNDYGISITYGFQEPVILSHPSCWSDCQLNFDSIVASFCSYYGEWQSFQVFWALWSMLNPKLCWCEDSPVWQRTAIKYINHCSDIRLAMCQSIDSDATFSCFGISCPCWASFLLIEAHLMVQLLAPAAWSAFHLITDLIQLQVKLTTQSSVKSQRPALLLLHFRFFFLLCLFGWWIYLLFRCFGKCLTRSLQGLGIYLCVSKRWDQGFKLSFQ